MLAAMNPLTSLALSLMCAALIAPVRAQEPTQPNLLLQMSLSPHSENPFELSGGRASLRLTEAHPVRERAS